MGLIAGDFRCKASIIVLNLLAADFFGGVAGGYYCVGAVHALGEGDCLSCAAIGFAHNAVSEIFGDIEVFGTFNYSNLSFSCILADDGVLVLSVHCCVYHGEGAVVIADHSSGDVLDVWYCVITQVLDDFFPPYGGISCGIYAPFIGSDGDRAAVFIENGFCTVVHTAIRCKNFGCHIAHINLGIVEWFASQGHMIRFEATLNFQSLGGEFVIDYHIITGDSPGSIDINCIFKAAAGKGGCAVTDTGALYFTAGGYHITASGNFSGGCDGGACNGAADDGAVLGIQAGAGNGGAGNGFTRNISCRNDIMSIDIMSIDVACCIQISGLEGSYTVCQFISGNCTPSINVLDAKALHTGKSAVGSDVHRADFAGCCCDFAVCANRKLSLSPFDGTVSIESRFSISLRIAAGK